MCYIVITKFYSRRWLTFSVQDQIVNILAFSNLWVLASSLTTQLCHSVQSGHRKLINEDQGCVPIKLDLWVIHAFKVK